MTPNTAATISALSLLVIAIVLVIVAISDNITL